MMINKSLFLLTLIIVLLVSCKDATSEKDDALKNKEGTFSSIELKGSIKQMEDSIAGMLQNKSSIKLIPNLTYIELINRLKTYYKRFPNDPYSAECLFKIHIKYSDLKAQKDAMAYGDTLLSKFPTYKNRDFLLESMASSYDVIIEPRDTAMVRKYYSLLLKESNLLPEKRQDIGFRLKHLELDFFEFIDFQSKQVTKRKK